MFGYLADSLFGFPCKSYDSYSAISYCYNILIRLALQ